MAVYKVVGRRGRRREAGTMTLQEYLATPESVLPQELIFGTMRVADAPFVSHQRAVLKLAMALQACADAHGGEVLVAPIDVILDRHRALVVQPDLVFISSERSGLVGDRIDGAPDLVVEVLSPRPRIGRLSERVGWFATYGVREIWLYHQTMRRLEVLSCQSGAVTASVSFNAMARVRSDVLPEFDRTMTSVLGAYY